MNVLDTSGLRCPLPVLKAKKALKLLSAGEKLKIIATDPGAIKDFHHFNSLGYKLTAEILLEEIY